MTTILLLLIFSIGRARAIKDWADEGCTAASGHCQDDSTHCAGSYQSGLCSGAANRRCCVPTGSGGSGSCSNIHIVTRSQWGAKAATAHTAMPVPASEFFIHHTETPPCTDQAGCIARVKNIQDYHMVHNGWSDIGYSFLVGEDGNVYEGRGWSYVGAHTENYNSKGFAASMIGSFDTHVPNAKALTAVKNLIACGVQLGKISGSYRLYGHRDAGQTSCPGTSLYNLIQTWPHYSHAHP